MGNVARFAALSTKLDAISGRFLQEEDYEALLHKEKVTEVWPYQKNTKNNYGMDPTRKKEIRTMEP